MPLDVNIVAVNGATVTIDNTTASPSAEDPEHPREQTSVLNFATNDFLGLHSSRVVKEAARMAMRDYGCGACGPRGFYGTTDLHLQCEHQVAKFCNSSNAILYSFGAATSNSTIPAFCKRGDVVVVDEHINFALYSGVKLSRANMITFRHNDMASLEAVLKDVCQKYEDKNHVQRRFIVVEAIYANSGHVAPLDRIVALKNKYKFRLLLDESFSIGVLGNGGRGALQQFGIARNDVEICTADLGNAIASVGGFCVGNTEVVEHQRLSGAGYCFSASQPPFLAAAATAALSVVEQEGESLVSRLRCNVKLMKSLMDMAQLKEAGWYIDGDELSPFLFARRYDDDADGKLFTDVQKRCLNDGILVSRPVYCEDELKVPKDAVKITVSAIHSEEMIRTAAEVLMRNLLLARD
ncbi:serine palmitoyltransferase LCB1 subunit [Gracilaria domingensis]|nr:serine palmitoyltransferase LCB1 subunit [Gracilaria domingensis]